ncbi:hypothetical protein AB0N07_41225 [Streptomyces sp. NPDC051172]|uniref:hypothetical protein n=1 Tax=Streptomyces sp. NPDC051172 TaxID=3155796 RepID=UPI0034192EB5
MRVKDMAARFHQVARAGHDRHRQSEVEREHRPHEHPWAVVVHRDRVVGERAAQQTEAVHLVQSAWCQ